MKLSVNTGFLVNRYPSPYQWCKVIKELDVKNIQLTADLFSPNYPDQILKEEVKVINKLSKEYDFKVYSAFTGGFTRVNHFCHPNKNIRDYWLSWFGKFAEYTAELGAKRLGSHIGIISIPDNIESREEFQERCISYWIKLAEIASNHGIEELTWEHMSIQREQGHTCEDINKIIKGLKDAKIPIRMCLDPDHGDLTSHNKYDYEPYGLIDRYIAESSQIHLKQTTKDKRSNGPFTLKNNKNGLINAQKVLNHIYKNINKDSIDKLELILEINSREREPDDSQIINAINESLNYWRKALSEMNLKYE